MSMKIGLVDVDGHNFPNVALMKIASWHRQTGGNQGGGSNTGGNNDGGHEVLEG